MNYEFDWKNFNLKTATDSVLQQLLRFLAFVVLSFSLTAVVYIVLAFVVDTPEEARLKASTARMQHLYDSLMVQEQILEDALTGLQKKDAAIYQAMFNSAAPNEDPIGKLDHLFASDTIPDTRLMSYTRSKADELLCRADDVDRSFARIFRAVTDDGFILPPMSLPLKNVSYPQVGAGAGPKMNPFFRTVVRHRGLDLIVPQGEPVHAASDGIVIEAGRTLKGQGRTVSLQHSGGYVTRYAHLSEVSVSKGQRVKRGAKIGCAGMSGNAVAPHLHYEILRDTLYLNPINYIFASVGPEEYANMLFMAANTMQSMD